MRSRECSLIGYVVFFVLLCAIGGSSQAAGIGTVQGATSDASGNLIDITFDVEGSPETLAAGDLIGSTLVLSTLTPDPVDANRFWTLDGAAEPTEAQALRSVGDKYMGTALQDCASTSQHDTLFDEPIIPGPGPEIFLYHGGHNDAFVILDDAGVPALTIPNNVGNPVSVYLSDVFRAWYLRNNANYQVQGTFPHYDIQSHIVALDLDASDVAAIGGLRFGGGPCDYVYEILGRQPNRDREVPFASPKNIPRDTSVGDLAIAADFDGDGDLDTVIAPGPGSIAPDMVWLENNGGASNTWIRRPISTSDAWVSVGADDLDGDGDVDVFASTATDVAWFENDGASPPSWIERGISDSEMLVSSVEVADLGRDGDLDLLVATSGNDGEVLWFESNGAAPPEWTRRVVSDGSDSTAVATADLDGDGDLDVVLAGEQDAGGPITGLVQTIRNDGGGTPVTVGEPLTDRSTNDLAAGFVFISTNTPFGVDGRLARWTFYDDDGPGRRITPLIFREDGQNPGNYTVIGIGETRQSDGSGIQVFEFQPIAGSSDAVRAGDFYGWKDGTPDNSIKNAGVIDMDLTVNVTAPAYSVWGTNNDAPPVIQGTTIDNASPYDFRFLTPGRDYSVQFTVEPWIWTPLTASLPPNRVRSLAVGDIDRDGDIDAAIAAPDLGGGGNATLLWLDNDGSGLWSSNDAADPDQPVAVELLDVNMDGDLDVLYGTAGAGTVAWLPNYTGLGNFGAARHIASGITADVEFGDLDRDGDIDVLASADEIAWIENRTIHRSGIFPTKRVITNTINSPDGVFAADVDGDGDIDALSSSNLDNTIAWYENNGGVPPSWTKRIITNTDVSAHAVVTADVDGDGDMDVFSAAFSDDTISWHENDGASPPNWTKRIITNSADGARSVVAADVDGDGDMDALSASEFDDTIAWYENDGASPPNWTKHTITNTADSAVSVFATDVDRDGDIDALSASQLDDTIAWYENDGASPPSWTKRTITDTTDNCFSVFAADVDGDGDIDALSASQPEDLIAWYENDGASPPSWTKRSITNTADGAISVFAADVDADGDLDVLSASFNDNTIAWYENNGASPPSWNKQIITNTAFQARTVFAADVDDDGDLDVLSASANDDTIAWYENKGGQFRNFAADCFSGPIREGEEELLASVDLRLNARSGDSPGRVTRTRFDLGLDPFGPLSTVLDTLRLYRDDGDGEFGASDVLMDTIDVATFVGGPGGIYDLEYPVDDPNGILAAPARFFLTGQVAPSASSSGFATLDFSHGVGNTKVSDANAGIPLSEEDDGSTSSCAVSRAILRTIAVDDTSDAVDAFPGDGSCATAGATCTLRAAIMEANDSPGSDRIALPPGTYLLTRSGSGEDDAATGDLDVLDALTLVGAGAGTTIIDAQGLGDRVFDVFGSGQVTFEGLTIQGGSTTSAGGGLQLNSASDVDLVACVVSASTALSGGGIAMDSATLDVSDSAISGNFASAVGGAIGGSGTLGMTRSLVSQNTATQNGGGLRLAGGTATLEAVTISGNVASIGNGGGINHGGSLQTLTLDNVTVYGNSAAFGGGIAIDATLVTTSVANSIIAGNQAPAGPDCAIGNGSLTSAGYNLFQTVCVASGDLTGNQIGVDPQLAPLGDYGGPTLTHRPLLGSPAIDSGSCAASGSTLDQTGELRPIDIGDIPNADDGCDVGAFEARLGQAQVPIEIPIRWCGLHGAPSIENPGLIGENSFNDVMRRRHETASDEIYFPRAGLILRSAGNFAIPDYPLIDDPDCVGGPPCGVGLEGDVLLNLDAGDFFEFHEVVAACRRAWEELDPDIQGITAVNIGRFVGPDGEPLEIQGVGGRAPFGDAAEQLIAGRLLIVDNFYRQVDDPPNPLDTVERLFGHELGHALSLGHGNGLDDDQDLFLDNNDEAAVGLPRFDGPNLLQYRNGSEISDLQAIQMRSHALLTIPDAGAQPFSDSTADGTPLDEENRRVLQFGYDALTELENRRVLEFENRKVLEFENRKVLEFENRQILQFENRQILQFENRRVLQFGMDYSGTQDTDTTTFHLSLGGLPWPAAIRPDSRYYFYLDFDTSDGTGGYPAEFPNPSDPGNNFPGSNNFVDEPPVGEEVGVDLILQVTLGATCPGEECDATAVLDVFDFNDDPAAPAYDLVFTDPAVELSTFNVGLYQDNGGQDVEFDEVPTGFTIRPVLLNSDLFAAGWGFQAGPNGPVPNHVGIEVLTTIECSGRILNDDMNSAVVDCRCDTCGECPDYPGCVGTTGTPRQLDGTRIVTDNERSLLTFEPPVLPEAVVSPVLAEEGQMVAVNVLDLPTNIAPAGTVEVTLDGAVLGTVSTDLIDASGNVSLTVPLPFGKLGEQTLSAGITGRAPRARAIVTITPFLDFPDNDGDGIPDSTDPDDDNDGVPDTAEISGGSDPFNPRNCGDSDTDSCDDCSSGTFAPADDGPDFDLDGQCNEGDPDDDNDGVPDTSDTEPENQNACGVDTDADTCDDCSLSGSPDPANDGPDIDGDGLCNAGDPNQHPVAACTDVSVNADAQCEATASIDDGSYDPEGETPILTQDPAGPYGLGDTTVTLTVADSLGESDTCSATVTVVDLTTPTITACAVDRTLVADETDGRAELADLTGEVTTGDACGAPTVTQDPVAGTRLAAGVNEVTFSSTDGSANSVSCTADVTVLDRVLSENEKVRVHFHHLPDGTMDVDDGGDDEGDDVPGGPPVPRCFTRLDLDGDLQVRDAGMLPADIRGPNGTEVDARLVVSLSGQVISDEALVLELKNGVDEKWEYKRPDGQDTGTKKLKIDWTDTSSYDSHLGTGLGAETPRITTLFIGFDETETKIKYRDVPRPFSVTFDDPLYGTFVIGVLDADGTATTSPPGDFDLRSKRTSLTLELPFRLTSDTAISFSTDGGTTQTEIPVDPELNYQPAGGKYKLDLDRTTVSAELCDDPATPVNSLGSPELDVELRLGAGLEQVVGRADFGPDPAEWTQLDDAHWKVSP